MDREEKSPLVTWYHLQKMKDEIQIDYRREDEKIKTDMKQIDNRVDKLVEDVTQMKSDMHHTNVNTAELVRLQREKNEHERETHKKMFERLDQHSIQISEHSTWIKETKDSKDKRDAKVKWIAGSIVSVLVALFGLLKVIAPYLFS